MWYQFLIRETNWMNSDAKNCYVESWGRQRWKGSGSGGKRTIKQKKYEALGAYSV